MCGIAGLIDRSRVSDAAVGACAKAMADAIAYRGPDGAGVWSDAEAGVALSHRRLAIIDLTATGAQPTTSADGRWVISYNGEVYNAEAIAARPDMASLVRRGTSDTEIIVESVARRGLERTLNDLNGMFAMALWDRANRTMHLVRDRLGIKPLFYTQARNGFYFASELKAFIAAGLDFKIDPASVTSFLRLAYVPAPFSIYRGIFKVLPGEVVSFGPDGTVMRSTYWDLNTVAAAGQTDPFAGSDAEAEEELHALLSDAVAGQMISDVPLGMFLSGGIDSSTIAALMTAAKRGPVKTFSIGFPDFGYDESAHARSIANHLGTVHQNLMVSADEALAIVPRLATMYDEPFADSSQIPTHAVSWMTRKHVTVALSGDGGDELFGGYNRYGLAEGRLRQLTSLPLPLRRVASAALKAVPETLAEAAARVVPRSMRWSQPADKLKKLAEVLLLDGDAVYLRLISQYPDPSSLTGGQHEHPMRLQWHTESLGDNFLERMQLFDTATYLPDDILQKVDRASMAVSLEVRPPLLDHRVVEFAWTLPRRLRLRGGETKWLLRRVLNRYVPRELIDRPKMGFGIPLASWLRGPLRGWAEDLVATNDLGGGFLDKRAVRQLWSDHIDGGRNWAYALWAVLMFEAWRHRWAGASVASNASLARAASAV
jgi:asparagine synthase (glutamine-hydrolysing)